MVLASVAVALVALSVGFYVVLSTGLERSADSVLAARADAVVATLSSSDGLLVIHDTPADDVLDAGVWIGDATGRLILRSPGGKSIQAAVARLLAAGQPASIDVGQATRLAARPFTLGSGASGTVVVSLSRLPYEQTERDTLVAMIAFGGVILIAVFIGSLGVIRVALKPVARMTSQAEEWSDHDPDRRFDLGPPRDEFSRLAATLDGLLERVAAALRREQRLTAEIAHELRTPLARARMTAELAVRRRRSAGDLRAALRGIVADLDTTSVALDVLLDAARGGDTHARGVCDAGLAAGVAVAEAQGLPGSDGLSWSVRVAEPLPLAGCDAPYLVRTLAPILQNAVTYARTQVDVEVATAGEAILFRITDDGPGMTELDARHIGEPGFRGSAAGDRPGHGRRRSIATAGRPATRRAAGSGCRRPRMR